MTLSQKIKFFPDSTCRPPVITHDYLQFSEAHLSNPKNQCTTLGSYLQKAARLITKDVALAFYSWLAKRWYFFLFSIDRYWSRGCSKANIQSSLPILTNLSLHWRPQQSDEWSGYVNSREKDACYNCANETLLRLFNVDSTTPWSSWAEWIITLT